MKNIFLLLLLASACFGAFGKKVPLTVASSQVSGTQTNFPVLVSLTISDLKTVANGGSVQNSSGYDIYAYSDSALTTRIPLERESYTATTGAVVLWVKLPSISSAADVTFYLAYSDTGIATDPNSDATYGKTAVWDSNYKGVWHLTDGSTLSGSDSTSNGNTATASSPNAPAATSGLFDGAGSFTGTGIGTDSQYLSAGNPASLQTTGTAVTVSAWVNPIAFTAGSAARIAAKQVDSNSDPYIDWGVYLNGGDKPGFFVGGTDASSASALSASTWYHLVGVYDGANIKVYQNGSVVATTAYTSALTNSSSNFYIGANPQQLGGTEQFQGIIDDVRVSFVARSASWVTTEYNNQNAPGTFVTAGTPVSTSVGTSSPGFVGHSQRNYVGAE